MALSSCMAVINVLGYHLSIDNLLIVITIFLTKVDFYRAQIRRNCRGDKTCYLNLSQIG